MLIPLALFSLVAAQPGIQQISFGNSGYHFGVSQTVEGSNPCPAFIECRACTSAIGCVWSGVYCYQVVYQVTTCSGNGCATNPSQCPSTSTPPATCNTCSNSGCPAGQNCQPTGTSYCSGTCQVSTSCPFGSQYDASASKCVVVSCRVSNACPPGYQCNVGTCSRSPCPVVCTPPTSCNACDPNPVCGQNQICQVAPTPASSVASYSYATSCVGTCVDSTAAPRTQACYALSSCTDCTSASYKLGITCIWNGVQCYPGNMPCRSRDCVTQPASCPSACAVPTCEACLNKNGCSWTGSSCFAATAPCTSSSCVQQASQCLAASTCSSLASCTTCLAVDGCVWNGQVCSFSNVPCDPRNGCVTTCESQMPCNGQDCTSCVAATNCHWSSSSSTCFYSKTPCTDRYCADTQSQCQTAQSCYGITTCRACAKISGCLWYGEMCYAVPCQGAACATLGYTSQCPQPQCERVGVCTDCTNTDGCVWTGYTCVSSDTYSCTNSLYNGCARTASQCPASSCAYGEAYDNSLRKCRAVSCEAVNACPQNYTCNTQPGCGASICPVVCTAPAPQCPQNEQWTSCSSSTCFEATCSDNYATRVCAQDCRSGCQCKNGFARAPGGSCVSQSSCSSYYNYNG